MAWVFLWEPDIFSDEVLAVLMLLTIEYAFHFYLLRFVQPHAKNLIS